MGDDGTMASSVLLKIGKILMKAMMPLRFLILTLVSSIPRTCSSMKRWNWPTKRSCVRLKTVVRNS